MTLPAAIVGSAFADRLPWPAHRVEVDTPWGPWTLHEVDVGRRAFVSARHGLPHRTLPHQINWRAQAHALASVGVDALLSTSSVGVLDPTLPLHQPLVVRDLVLLDSRLGDGTPVTLWPTPHPDQGHLVWNGPACTTALLDPVRAPLAAAGVPLGPEVTFAWQTGPRTKTPAENVLWRHLRFDVNAMTLAPEVVLAAELQIPAVGVAVGHKHSGPDAPAHSHGSLAQSLADGRHALRTVVAAFLRHTVAQPSPHTLYRFGSHG